MTREEQVVEICRLVERRAGLACGEVDFSTSINKELGFDGQDLFDLIEEVAVILGKSTENPFDFNAYNSERSAIAVAIYYPAALLISKLFPKKFAPPISPTQGVDSLTPEKLRDILFPDK